MVVAGRAEHAVDGAGTDARARYREHPTAARGRQADGRHPRDGTPRPGCGDRTAGGRRSDRRRRHLEGGGRDPHRRADRRSGDRGILAAQSVRGTDLFLLVDQLTATHSRRCRFGDSGEIRRISDISTLSLPAFRLYLQGVDEFSEYRWDDARSLLERAVEIDPSFADAYLHLAHVHFFLGRYALQEEYLRKAADHVDRLGARQRLVLDAESARAAGDGAKAARALDELMRAFPDDEDGYNLTFQLYAPVSGLIHDPQKLLITQARGAAAVPQSSLTRNQYAYALLFTGRHEEAIREFENNVQLAGREVNPHDSLGEAYLVAGRLPESDRVLCAGAGHRPGFFRVTSGTRLGAGDVGAVR